MADQNGEKADRGTRRIRRLKLALPSVEQKEAEEKKDEEKAGKIRVPLGRGTASDLEVTAPFSFAASTDTSAEAPPLTSPPNPPDTPAETPHSISPPDTPVMAPPSISLLDTSVKTPTPAGAPDASAEAATAGPTKPSPGLAPRRIAVNRRASERSSSREKEHSDAAPISPSTSERSDVTHPVARGEDDAFAPQADAFWEDARPMASATFKVPLQFKTLSEAMESLADLHPLPVETLSAQEPHQFTWLKTQLRKINTKKELQDFAQSLTQKDLSFLFSTLSQLKKREETDPVQNLIRLRASHCLYLYGWITFQFCYPRSTLARALADLCKILEDMSFVKENEASERIQQRPNDGKKAGLLALPEIDIGYGRIIWSRVPLISDVAFPNSRHFISDLANAIIDAKMTLEAFYKKYAIYPGLPLSDAIQAHYNEKVTGDSKNPFLSTTFFDRFQR